jgi:uncharacterized protein YbcI
VKIAKEQDTKLTMGFISFTTRLVLALVVCELATAFTSPSPRYSRVSRLQVSAVSSFVVVSNHPATPAATATVRGYASSVEAELSFQEEGSVVVTAATPLLDVDGIHETCANSITEQQEFSLLQSWQKDKLTKGVIAFATRLVLVLVICELAATFASPRRSPEPRLQESVVSSFVSSHPAPATTVRVIAADEAEVSAQEQELVVVVAVAPLLDVDVIHETSANSQSSKSEQEFSLLQSWQKNKLTKGVIAFATRLVVVLVICELAATFVSPRNSPEPRLQESVVSNVVVSNHPATAAATAAVRVSANTDEAEVSSQEEGLVVVTAVTPLLDVYPAVAAKSKVINFIPILCSLKRTILRLDEYSRLRFLPFRAAVKSVLRRSKSKKAPVFGPVNM